MILSLNKDHPEYNTTIELMKSHYIRIFIEGSEITEVTEVDDVKGYAEIYVRDSNGNLVLCNNRSEIARKVIKGNIRIEATPRK